MMSWPLRLARAVVVLGVPLVSACGNVSREKAEAPHELCIGPHWAEIHVESTDTRMEATFVKAADGSVIIWGGLGKSDQSSLRYRTDGWRYFPDTGELRPLDGGPARAGNPAGAAFGNEVLVLGGYTETGAYPTDIVRYSITSETWSTLVPPEPYLTHLGATSDTWLLRDMFGSGSRYSATTGTWSSMNSLPGDGPYQDGAIVVGDELWEWKPSYPGYNPYLGPAAVWKYDVGADHWTMQELPDEPGGGRVMAWLSAVDGVAVWGAEHVTYSPGPSMTGWVMDVSTGERTPMNLDGAVSAMPAVRTVIDGKKIFQVSGYGPDEPLGAIYDAEANVWMALDTECGPEHATSAIAISDGRVLVWSNTYAASGASYETAYIYTP
jgi:hypothetical protein